MPPRVRPADPIGATEGDQLIFDAEYKYIFTFSELFKLAVAVSFGVFVSTRGFDLLFPLLEQGHGLQQDLSQSALQKQDVAMIADQAFYDKNNLVDLESFFELEIKELCAIDQQYTGCMEAERLFRSFQQKRRNAGLNKQLEKEVLEKAEFERIMNAFKDENQSLQTEYKELMKNINDLLKKIEDEQNLNSDLSDSLEKLLLAKDKLLKEKERLEAEMARKLKEFEDKLDKEMNKNKDLMSKNEHLTRLLADPYSKELCFYDEDTGRRNCLALTEKVIAEVKKNNA